ncbi:putative SWI5-dependent HO expression protein 3 [[Candida] jaroonii]|uniref:SWI5-dependent HO expression protein 3 n=1 Tax=[Candida] jaroonii TaxID=467808 RepID=A0ACA9Y2X3_9ASCO|nr:putative SWI5-dependent HO expression protein 3 [[Candida] jaroonii]
MEESPRKPTSSRVIDSLHQEIDSLKSELESTKLSNSSYKKKFEILSQKNESYVDQLANAKHENDMINALLKRKERRIVDLENEYNDILSSNENLKLTNKNMKIRCDNLQESSSQSTAEYERLKIAYDALTASQLEYKRHYESEIKNLNENFKNFKVEYVEKYENLSKTFNDNDKDIDSLLDGLTNKRKYLDNLYFNKNKLILELLSRLANISKIHGQDVKEILTDNLANISLLVEKYPDLNLKLMKDNDNSINLDDLLNESNDAINSSFDEEATLIEEPKLSRSNTLKKTNGKKNYGKRNSKFEERARTPTPPSNNTHTDKKVNNYSYNNSNNNNNSHKGKRRSMYGNKNISINT